MDGMDGLGAALAGGVLIGGASAALLVLNGRIAGVTGVLAGVLAPEPGEWGWRAAFAAGLLGVGALAGAVAPGAVGAPAADAPTLVLAGLLVGLGTRLGNGCTSGHGVCGIGRLSPRSSAATVVFIGAGALTVALARWLGGVA
jgi:uncharacterized membrane protein YedE/YeeE